MGFSKEVLSKFRDTNVVKFVLKDCVLGDGSKPENQKFRRLVLSAGCVDSQYITPLRNSWAIGGEENGGFIHFGRDAIP